MTEQLVGRIAWVQKAELAEPVPARRECRGLEGRIVHVQQAETAKGVLAIAGAVRATNPGAKVVQSTEDATGAVEAAEALSDLNPHFTQGPGRKLGL